MLRCSVKPNMMTKCWNPVFNQKWHKDNISNVEFDTFHYVADANCILILKLQPTHFINDWIGHVYTPSVWELRGPNAVIFSPHSCLMWDFSCSTVWGLLCHLLRFIMCQTFPKGNELELRAGQFSIRGELGPALSIKGPVGSIICSKTCI